MLKKIDFIPGVAFRSGSGSFSETLANTHPHTLRLIEKYTCIFFRSAVRSFSPSGPSNDNEKKYFFFSGEIPFHLLEQVFIIYGAVLVFNLRKHERSAQEFILLSRRIFHLIPGAGMTLT